MFKTWWMLKHQQEISYSLLREYSSFSQLNHVIYRNGKLCMLTHIYHAKTPLIWTIFEITFIVYLKKNRVDDRKIGSWICITLSTFCLQVFPVNNYRDNLAPYWQVDDHENISSISEIILGETKAYVIFDRHYGDLHSYVRQKKKLREEEASQLMEQIVAAVLHCHDNGVVLRDLKLRKFVFKNQER